MKKCAKCGHEEGEHILRTEEGKGCMAWREEPVRNGMCQCNKFEERKKYELRFALAPQR